MVVGGGGGGGDITLYPGLYCFLRTWANKQKSYKEAVRTVVICGDQPLQVYSVFMRREFEWPDTNDWYSLNTSKATKSTFIDHKSCVRGTGRQGTHTPQLM